jgi:uncharacterized protein YkwD
MNAVDLLLLAVIALGVWGGWRRGFMASSADLATLVLSVALTLAVYQWPARWLGGEGLGVWALPLAFLVTLLLVRIVLGMLAGALLAAVPERAHRHGANRALGLLPGGVQGLIHAAIVAALLLALPLGQRVHEASQASPLAEEMSRPVQWLEARLAPVIDPVARATLGRLTVQPGSAQVVQLPFRVAQARPRPDLEARMLELVNADRLAAGLRPLQADAELVRVSRAHSADMFARGYFSHFTPEGLDPFARLRAAKVRFRAAGENLALARTAQLAHDGLMDSPGHRANILRPAFGRLGIGVLDGGMRGLMVTQTFRD